MNDLVYSLGITGLSKSQVSEMARDPAARGPTGVKLVTRDAHAGLVTAAGATPPGGAGSDADPITQRT